MTSLVTTVAFYPNQCSGRKTAPGAKTNKNSPRNRIFLGFTHDLSIYVKSAEVHCGMKDCYNLEWEPENRKNARDTHFCLYFCNEKRQEHRFFLPVYCPQIVCAKQNRKCCLKTVSAPRYRDGAFYPGEASCPCYPTISCKRIQGLVVAGPWLTHIEK